MTTEGKFVRANGIDIHYTDEGKGEPLVLLHGGLMSTGRTWAGSPGAYVSRTGAFAEHFRVIAPDLRGHGKTVNPGGRAMTYAQLADDVVALVAALGLQRPMICGFSTGGSVATLAALRAAVRALVNDAGYDVLNPRPEGADLRLCRQLFGGRPDATEADPSATERRVRRARHGGLPRAPCLRPRRRLEGPPRGCVRSADDERRKVRGPPRDHRADARADRRSRHVLLGRGSHHGVPHAPQGRARDLAESRAQPSGRSDRRIAEFLRRHA